MKKLLLATTALFLLFAGPAHAGPVIGGIGLLVGGLTGALTATQVVFGIISLGASWLIGQMMLPKEKQRGVKTKMETGGDKPPGFILGEYATAGALDYVNVWDGGGIPQACLTYVIIASALPGDSISNIVYINGERCTVDWGTTDADGFSNVTDYDKYGNHYCKLKWYDGTQTGADPWLLDKFGDDPDRPWLDDMHLDGCAYIIAQCWYSNKGVWTGNPEFRFVVRGCHLYDPRKDSTVGGSGSQRWGHPETYGFTKNAKVIEFNTIRGIYYGGELVWGGGAEAYRLPLDYWFAAMNVCDENITKKNGDVINRYTMGAEIHFDDKPIEIIDEINKATCGYTTEYGGTYKTWCGGPGLSIATITDDDFLITAELETNRNQALTSIYNTAYATYPEPNEQWETKDGPQFQDADALAEDGQELAIDIQLPFVTENNQVQRVMRATVKDSRRQVTHQGQLPPEAFVFEPNDRLSFVSDDFGYHGDGKDFILASKDDLPNVNQQCLLREINPDDTGWLTAYELDTRVGPLTVIKPGTLSLDFTLTAVRLDTDDGRKDKPAILCEWDWSAIDIDVQNIKYEIRRVGTTTVIAEGRIRNPEDGSRRFTNSVFKFEKTYEMRLKPEPYSNRDAAWTGWKSVTFSFPPSTPISLEIDAGNKELRVKVNKCPDADYKRTILYQAEGTNDFGAAEEVARFATTQFVLKKLDNGTRYYHWVAFEDTSEAVGDKFPAGAHAGIEGAPVPFNDGDVDTGSFARSKTKSRAKKYSGIGTTTDNDFLHIQVANESGSAVKISWEWILAARYFVGDKSDAATTIVKATLWKQHGAGAKQALQTIHAKAKHPAGQRRDLHDSDTNRNNKVFHDPHPKKGVVTTYGIDVLYRGTGPGVHAAAVRRCELNVSRSSR